MQVVHRTNTLAGKHSNRRTSSGKEREFAKDRDNELKHMEPSVKYPNSALRQKVFLRSGDHSANVAGHTFPMALKRNQGKWASGKSKLENDASTSTQSGSRAGSQDSFGTTHVDDEDPIGPTAPTTMKSEGTASWGLSSQETASYDPSSWSSMSPRSTSRRSSNVSSRRSSIEFRGTMVKKLTSSGTLGNVSWAGDRLRLQASNGTTKILEGSVIHERPDALMYVQPSQGPPGLFSQRSQPCSDGKQEEDGRVHQVLYIHQGAAAAAAAAEVLQHRSGEKPNYCGRGQRNSFIKLRRLSEGFWQMPAAYRSDADENENVQAQAFLQVEEQEGGEANQNKDKVPQVVWQTEAQHSIFDDDENSADDLDQGQNPGCDEPGSLFRGHRRVDKRTRQLLKSMSYVDVFHLLQPLLESKAGELGCKDGSRAILKLLATTGLPTPMTNKSAIKQRTFLTRKFGSMSFYTLAMMLAVRADGPSKVVGEEARDALIRLRASRTQGSPFISI